jgi:hypothetical protein
MTGKQRVILPLPGRLNALKLFVEPHFRGNPEKLWTDWPVFPD